MQMFQRVRRANDYFFERCSLRLFGYRLLSLIICFPLLSGSLVFAAQLTSSDQSLKIHVKKGKKLNYYHLEYVFTQDNLIMHDAKSELTLINEGGYFSVAIKKTDFPIRAPNCSKDIELIMPRTKSTRLSALKKISKKTALYYSLIEVTNGLRKELKVIVELNPNIHIRKRQPLVIELTNCQIFFRTARDGYVDYIGSFK